MIVGKSSFNEYYLLRIWTILKHTIRPLRGVKKISCGKGRLYSCVRSISANSYGMYLMHMMILPFLFALINPLFPTAVTIILTSVSTYVICYIITKILSLPRWGKYIVG